MALNFENLWRGGGGGGATGIFLPIAHLSVLPSKLPILLAGYLVHYKATALKLGKLLKYNELIT